MSVFLADGNLLVALTVVDHIHHDVALDWFEQSKAELATCPITEGTLLRFLVRERRGATEAIGVLDAIRGQSWHRFWPDAIPYEGSQLVGVIGHRQVTDAYLVAPADHNGGRVATLDKGLAALHTEGAYLINA